MSITIRQVSEYAISITTSFDPIGVRKLRSAKNTETESERRKAKRACSRSSECNIDVFPSILRTISAENLSVKFSRIFSKKSADYVLRTLDEGIEEFSRDYVKKLPLKQVSFGDRGLLYSSSGTSVPAAPWTQCLVVAELKQLIEAISGCSFNFVLVNRFKDGMDHLAEHRVDEKYLVAKAPIAYLSLGQARDFIFKYKDARGTEAVSEIDPIKMELEHGTLLLMEWPTNKFWYHSLPMQKKAANVKLNLTFYKMVKKNN